MLYGEFVINPDRGCNLSYSYGDASGIHNGADGEFIISVEVPETQKDYCAYILQRALMTVRAVNMDDEEHNDSPCSIEMQNMLHSTMRIFDIAVPDLLKLGKNSSVSFMWSWKSSENANIVVSDKQFLDRKLHPAA